MIFSVAYMLARRLLGCLMVLARREVSKDAELLVLRNENRARPHRALGQLAPAEAGTRPPEVNLAEHRIRRKQVLGGLTYAYEYQIAA